MVRELNVSPLGEVEAYALSPMQQGMLFHRLNGDAMGIDLEQVTCELHEPIDAAKFEQAWREVVDRHAPLRTGFEWDERGEPRQVVYPRSQVRFALHHQDFGCEDEARRGLQEYLRADRREGFRTLTPPLIRVALLRGGPAHFWFVTTYHHLLLDARSMTILFREVMELHDAFVRGHALELPRPRPYRNYIDWLQNRDDAQAETFWRDHLRGFTAPATLAIARSVETRAGGHAVDEIAFRLSEGTTARLRAVARKHDVTLNTLTQAAWSQVVSRYSGSDDVVFGAVRAGRKIPVEGVEAMVGLFINTVPVRVRLAGDTPIGEWLRQIRQQWIALRDVEHTPLARVQTWSEVPPGQPLFDTILSFQEPAWDAALHALGGPWTRRAFDIRAQPTFPVALEVLAGATLTVKCTFDPVVFAGDAVGRVMAYFRLVLETLAAETADTIGALPLLTRDEQKRLDRWNDTATSEPSEPCVHRLVERQAREFPARIAVADCHGALNYADLNARANQFARHLRTLGVERGTRVAVGLERSVEMVVAWLGILKAGAAFVPLDLAYPQTRLAFQIEDCGTSVVIVPSGKRAALPTLSAEVRVVEMFAGGTGFEEQSGANLPPEVTARDVAYVIYTSGSTGRPKGVEVEHRALMNLVQWHQRAYAITPEDRATHLASPAFDASVWEIWPYLAAGASVHIPDDAVRVSASELWRWLAAERITISFMPTPLAEAVMAETWPQGLALRALLTGGDTLKRRPPPAFPCALINHYGPTECAVVATAAEIDPFGTRLPIGRPIANTQAFVLDGELRPVPIGVPGELFLGGRSLARGYLNRPELTAEKFIPHPFERGEGARLYRTGDRVRWTLEGELEFLGRLDGQVKIRGCRIELGEIEAALQQHPAVRECIVQARTDDRAGQQLVAYIVAAPDAPETQSAEIGAFLRAKLPAYMIPSAIIPVPAWPLTPNGKIDREALSMAANVSEPGRRSAAPATPLEETIGRVWADVLGCATMIGRADNFFDLGGHSLLAAQVVSRLNATLPTGISVRALFDQPTLAGFSREVEQRLADNPTRLPLQRLRSRRRNSRTELETNPRR